MPWLWRLFKPAVFIACSIKLLSLAYGLRMLLTGRDPSALGADPSATLLHDTGLTALTMLLITLTVTPLRRWTGLNRLQSIRRMLGVWSFTYALAHLTVYLAFDQLCYSVATCQWNAIWQDLVKRKFIFAGQSAFFILLLLAITSTSGWVRRLKKNWTRLHRLVYVASLAAVLHFLWMQKSGFARPLPWAIWLGVLLLARVYFVIAKRMAKSRSAVTA